MPLKQTFEIFEYSIPKNANGKLPFKCEHCDARFKSEQSMKKHISVAHEESIKCEICDLVFKSNQRMKGKELLLKRDAI